MQILLVNPWIYDFAAYDLWAKPLGLLKIADVFLKLGIKISFIDCLDRFHPRLIEYLKGKVPRGLPYGCGNYYTEIVQKPPIFAEVPRYYKRYGFPQELFLKILSEIEPPQIILVSSSMTYWYPGVFEAIRLLRKKFSDTPIILGGIYARLCPRHAQEKSGADFVYSGNSLREILDIINKVCGTKFNLDKIDLNQIFYAYNLYPKISYITLRGSQGCPFRCSYCGWYLLEENYSFMKPEFILEMIKYYYKEGIRNFAFYDDAFLYNFENYSLKIMEGIIREKIKANFHTPNGLHICYINKEIARLLKRSGFIHPRLGLEFFFPKEQKKFGTKTEFRQFLQAITYLKEGGYNPHEIGVNLMIGLPEQDLEVFVETVDFLAELNLRIHLEEYSPVPGTPLYLRSGLTPESDPLWHNNSIFSFYAGKDKYFKIQKIKEKIHKINAPFVGN